MITRRMLGELILVIPSVMATLEVATAETPVKAEKNPPVLHASRCHGRRAGSGLHVSVRSPARSNARQNRDRNGFQCLASPGPAVHRIALHRERGEAAGHDSDGWRREIMRLNKLNTGKEIWAGRSMTNRVEGEDGKLSKVVPINAPHADGRASLRRAVIARWPHDGMSVDLGQLDQEDANPAK